MTSCFFQVLAKAFHAAAAYFALVSIYRNTQVIRSEWSHELKPKGQSPGTNAHKDTHVTGTAWAGLDSHGRYEKAAGLKQVRVYFLLFPYGQLN